VSRGDGLGCVSPLSIRVHSSSHSCPPFLSTSQLAPLPGLATRTRSQCLGFRGCGSLSCASELDAGGIFGGDRYSVHGLAHSPGSCASIVARASRCPRAAPSPDYFLRVRLLKKWDWRIPSRHSLHPHHTLPSAFTVLRPPEDVTIPSSLSGRARPCTALPLPMLPATCCGAPPSPRASITNDRSPDMHSVLTLYINISHSLSAHLV